jgi:hypothetical protein
VSGFKDGQKGWAAQSVAASYRFTIDPSYQQLAYATPGGGALTAFPSRADFTYSGGQAYCIAQSDDQHQWGSGLGPGLYSRIVFHGTGLVVIAIPPAGKGALQVVAADVDTTSYDSTSCY